MRSYQVFLPPPVLTPFGSRDEMINVSSSGLKFITLPTPLSLSQEIESLHSSLGSDARTQSIVLDLGSTENLLLSGEVKGQVVQAGSVEKSYEKSTILGKRDFDQLHNDNDNPQSEVRSRIDERGVRGGNVTADTSVFSWPPTIPLPSASALRKLDAPVSRKSTLIKHNKRDGAVKETQPQRRSRRIRTTGSLLATLPQLEPSPYSPSRSGFGPEEESGMAMGTYDSLDSTTDDFASQLHSQSQSQARFGREKERDRSVYNLPNWFIPLSKLSTLHSLLAQAQVGQLGMVIICILSVDQPQMRKRKEDRIRGKEGTLCIGKWVVTAPSPSSSSDSRGTGEGMSCIVKLWESCAEEWGENVRRGDVVLLENVEAKLANNKEPSHLVLTPSNRPKMTILYRTLPRYTQQATKSDYIYHSDPRAVEKGKQGEAQGRTMISEDRALRPDLRVGRSDAGVRKVNDVARWFADWVGGEGPL